MGNEYKCIAGGVNLKKGVHSNQRQKSFRTEAKNILDFGWETHVWIHCYGMVGE